MEKNETDAPVTAALKAAKGIIEAFPLVAGHRNNILSLEEEAEKKSLMGLGKVVNAGVREVMDCDLVYVALTGMDFDWAGGHPSLVLKKGEEVVGKETRDEDEIARLSTKKNVWFMHRNFVVYRDRISFPQDIMKKICHFEIPCIPAEWCIFDSSQFKCRSAIHANPATSTDLFLKEEYFGGVDEKGTGTILLGITL
ncbi:MAG: hypothetical protein HN416_15090 [Nitrospina sp.]|nr:hypothetical protein [Nitrospina sp.]